ncbi:MAG: hypothetical protein P9M14_06245 [Candidatus Alcyoniella australis]|nr:hypothetical protein [Candidatus Alcyoniella australis]
MKAEQMDNQAMKTPRASLNLLSQQNKYVSILKIFPVSTDVVYEQTASPS